jgi:hypothetical protein
VVRPGTDEQLKLVPEQTIGHNTNAGSNAGSVVPSLFVPDAHSSTFIVHTAQRIRALFLACDQPSRQERDPHSWGSSSEMWSNSRGSLRCFLLSVSLMSLQSSLHRHFSLRVRGSQTLNFGPWAVHSGQNRGVRRSQKPVRTPRTPGKWFCISVLFCLSSSILSVKGLHRNELFASHFADVTAIISVLSLLSSPYCHCSHLCIVTALISVLSLLSSLYCHCSHLRTVTAIISVLSLL